MKTCNILNSGVSPWLIRNFDRSEKCKISYKEFSLMKLGRSHFRICFSIIEHFKGLIKLVWAVLWFSISHNTLKSPKDLEAHFSHCVHWQGINLNWLQPPACCQPTKGWAPAWVQPIREPWSQRGCYLFFCSISKQFSKKQTRGWWK